jgi:hypothetical protein
MTAVSGPANVTAVTAGLASAVVSAAHPRRYLGIYNQSAGLVYVAFDRPAVAAATAGQLTLAAVGAVGANVEWNGNFIPGNAISMIAPVAGPVTLLE